MTPFALLSESTGMQKVARGRNVLELLRKLPGNIRDALGAKPLLGEDVAARARKGVDIHHAGDYDELFRYNILGDNRAGRFVDKLLEPLTRKSNVRGVGIWQEPAPTSFPGIKVDAAGVSSAYPDRHFVGRTPSHISDIGESKMKEYQHFGDLLPRTELLSDVLRRYGTRVSKSSERAMDALRREFGKFVVKVDNGAASSASGLVTERSSPGALQKLLNTWRVPAKGFVAQSKIDGARLGLISRMVNNNAELHWEGKLGEALKLFSRDGRQREHGLRYAKAMLGGKLPFKAKYSLTGSDKAEYRVHVIDGKVIPYATLLRSSLTGSLPIRLPVHSRVEKAVQAQLDKLPPGKAKGMYGFDVMKTRDGGFKVVETNPTSPLTLEAGGGGGSGFLDRPIYQDAVAAALQGRLPRYIKAQRAVLGGTAAHAGGLALTPSD